MEKKRRSCFFQLVIGAMLVFSILAYASSASAETEYPVPLEGRDFFIRKGPKATSLYVEIGLRWMWSPNFAKVISKRIGKPITTYNIRRDNTNKTIAVCQKAGDGFYLSSSKDHAGFSRSSDAVWSDCPQERRYVYLLPKEVLEITGFKHVTIETKLEVAEALEKCADAACVEKALRKLGNPLKLTASTSASPPLVKAETPVEQDVASEAKMDESKDDDSSEPSAVPLELKELRDKLREKDVELAAASASSKKQNYLLIGLAVFFAVWGFVFGRSTKRGKQRADDTANFSPGNTVAQAFLDSELANEAIELAQVREVIIKDLKLKVVIPGQTTLKLYNDFKEQLVKKLEAAEDKVEKLVSAASSDQLEVARLHERIEQQDANAVQLQKHLNEALSGLHEIRTLLNKATKRLDIEIELLDLNNPVSLVTLADFVLNEYEIRVQAQAKEEELDPDQEEEPVSPPTFEGALSHLASLACNGTTLAIGRWATLQELFKLLDVRINILPEAFAESGMDEVAVARKLGKVCITKRLKDCRLENLRSTISIVTNNAPQ